LVRTQVTDNGVAELKRVLPDIAVRVLRKSSPVVLAQEDDMTAADYLARATKLYQNGEYNKAIGDCTEAIRLDRKFASAYNRLAWLLATCPDSEYRNGKTAVQYAMKACELSKWKNPGFLDTLAAAYSEAGEFTEAVKWQEKAIELAPEEEKANCRFRLHLYKSGESYREEPTR
jgi:serine/threonine-protein kinase